MIKNLLLIAFLLSWGCPATGQSCREIIGYYPSWASVQRNHLVTPATIPYPKYTVINYAFLKPAADGNIEPMDPWLDNNLLFGPVRWQAAPAGYDTLQGWGNPAYHFPNQKFSDYAHAGGCKFMLSVGGWSDSGLFPAISADPSKRARFAGDCRRIVAMCNADGIDVDWEYPGYADHNGAAADKQNFTLLLRQIRDSLDVLESGIGRELWLSACFGAGPERYVDIDWPEVVKLLDLVNLMTYDYYSTWDTITSHNAPLYTQSQNAHPGASIAESALSLLNEYHVPARKLTLGIPFYGHTQTTRGPAGLFLAGTGAADTKTFPGDGGSPLYYEIVASKALFDDHWDEVSKVPYRTGKNGLHTFLSYDDERSVEMKAQYIKQLGLRGVIVWEITGDCMTDPSRPGMISATPLIDKINAVFCQPDKPNRPALSPSDH